MKNLLLLLPLLMLGACTSSIHMSQLDIDSNSQKQLENSDVIEIERAQKNILGFVYNTNYVDQAHADLLQQCPDGTVVINVEYLTNHGFLSWTDKIRIKAICK